MPTLDEQQAVRLDLRDEQDRRTRAAEKAVVRNPGVRAYSAGE